jgi:hypothetical protein
VSLKPHNPSGLAPRRTTVANVSTTERFPIERASTRKPTRPLPSIKEPGAQVRAGEPERPWNPAAVLQQRQRVQRNMPVPKSQIAAAARGATSHPLDPPEGIGRGEPRPGGFKVR